MIDLSSQTEADGGVPSSAIARLTAIVGDSAVTRDAAALEDFAHDAWPVSVLERQLNIHPHLPDVVVTVTNAEQIADVLGVARENKVPVVARGLGSSVTGQPLPTAGGIVLDMSKLNGEPVLDSVNLTVTAPAGSRGSELDDWLRARGYTLNFFPQSLARSSIGGWVATRATGQLSSRYGGIEDAVIGYDVILADGSTMRIGQRPRAAVGPDLKQLFLGSEGTLGIVTSVTLKVYPMVEFALSEAWELPSVADGLLAMRKIYQAGVRPALMRFYDEAEARHAAPAYRGGKSLIFLTHEGLEPIARAEHAASTSVISGLGGVSLGVEPVERWYSRRFDFSTVEKLLDEQGGYAETIEVAHMWSDIELLYNELTTALAPYADEVLGHFSHVYTQGASLYVILLGRAESDEQAHQRLLDIWRVAMETTTRVGGELSHHHGAGLARQEFIPQNLGAQHALIARLKDALDPDRILNPGHLGL